MLQALAIRMVGCEVHNMLLSHVYWALLGQPIYLHYKLSGEPESSLSDSTCTLRADMKTYPWVSRFGRSALIEQTPKGHDMIRNEQGSVREVKQMKYDLCTSTLE